LKIGLISDIHGNLPGLSSCWKTLEALGVEDVVCLGDLVQYGPFPSEVVDFVIEHEIDVVQGNCDRAVGKGRTSTGDEFDNVHWKNQAEDVLDWTAGQLGESRRRYLRRLPFERRYRIGRWDLLCVHGLPGNIAGGIPVNAAREVYDLLIGRNSCNVLALGHTHEMFLKSLSKGMILNPGSLGGGTLPGCSTMAVLEIDDETGILSVSWHRVPFDTAEYESRYRSTGLPDTFLKCVLLGRDPRGKWHTDDINRRQQWAEPF
jgi:putative phosphoesterase